jgi:phosphoribosylanthranilate isomerase
MIPVKICGITNLEDAQATVRSGASALGFIFYDKSVRYITMETAYRIAADVQGQVPLIGVFVDETLDYVNGVAEEIGLNFIQLHGNESPTYCQGIQFPVIKVFRVSSDFNVGIIKSYNVHAFLFDTYKNDKPGGTGEVFNWDKISNLQIDTPIILSGGLSIENIKDAIDAVCPSAVDVNSGLESKPGKKNEKKMISLFEILKNTQSATNPFEIPVIQRDSYDI